LGIAEHQSILKQLISGLDNVNEFVLSEELIKELHAALMESPFAWETDFKPELVGNYRNIPAVGSREPFFENKEYIAHFNLDVIMPSYVDIFNNKFRQINNTNYETHLLTVIANFHNTFLNKLHPFADGNGRVCRIIMGAILMSNNCPPIFPQIIDQNKQVEYITKIIECEKNQTDEILTEYFARGMTNYLLERLK
jgi:Fic family protein